MENNLDEKPWTRETEKMLENLLSAELGVCSCQRYWDRIIPVIKKLFDKFPPGEVVVSSNVCTPEELLIIALMDWRNSKISHGTNIEYPFINADYRAKVLEYIEAWERHNARKPTNNE